MTQNQLVGGVGASAPMYRRTYRYRVAIVPVVPAATMQPSVLLLGLLGLRFGAIDALHVAGEGRVPLETGGEVTVLRNASEPPFSTPAAAAALAAVCAA